MLGRFPSAGATRSVDFHMPGCGQRRFRCSALPTDRNDMYISVCGPHKAAWRRHSMSQHCLWSLRPRDPRSHCGVCSQGLRPTKFTSWTSIRPWSHCTFEHSCHEASSLSSSRSPTLSCELLYPVGFYRMGCFIGWVEGELLYPGGSSIGWGLIGWDA